MGRLDDDNINSCHDEALFQDTFEEPTEGDIDDRHNVIVKSMWEDYQHRLTARILDEEDEENSSFGYGDGDKSEYQGLLLIFQDSTIPPTSLTVT
jgi:hypothetical protein